MILIKTSVKRFKVMKKLADDFRSISLVIYLFGNVRCNKNNTILSISYIQYLLNY